MTVLFHLMIPAIYSLSLQTPLLPSNHLPLNRGVAKAIFPFVSSNHLAGVGGREGWEGGYLLHSNWVSSHQQLFGALGFSQCLPGKWLLQLMVFLQVPLQLSYESLGAPLLPNHDLQNLLRHLTLLTSWWALTHPVWDSSSWLPLLWLSPRGWVMPHMFSSDFLMTPASLHLD